MSSRPRPRLGDRHAHLLLLPTHDPVRCSLQRLKRAGFTARGATATVRFLACTGHLGEPHGKPDINKVAQPALWENDGFGTICAESTSPSTLSEQLSKHPQCRSSAASSGIRVAGRALISMDLCRHARTWYFSEMCSSHSQNAAAFMCCIHVLHCSCSRTWNRRGWADHDRTHSRCVFWQSSCYLSVTVCTLVSVLDLAKDAERCQMTLPAAAVLPRIIMSYHGHRDISPHILCDAGAVGLLHLPPAGGTKVTTMHVL